MIYLSKLRSITLMQMYSGRPRTQSLYQRQRNANTN
jgi:hypothetical protein